MAGVSHHFVPNLAALNIFRRSNKPKQIEEPLTNFDSLSDDEIHERNVRNLKRFLIGAGVAVALVAGTVYGCRTYKAQAHPQNMNNTNYQLNQVQQLGR